jgi:predicted RNA methylase
MAKRPPTAIHFTPYEIAMCLHDVQRTRLWKQAVEDVVREGDVVVDAGSGTGILAAFAALDGARHVYAIELHSRFCRLIAHLAERNGVAGQVSVMEGDAAQVELPEPVDVVICELLCTGQFFEPQMQVVKNLRRRLKPGGRIIPQRIEHFVQLLDAQEQLYGVRIDVDSRSQLLADDEPVSTCERYAMIDLTQPVQPESVNITVPVRARKTRVADAVAITSRAQLTERLVTERTRFLYNPEVIFLKRPVELVKDKIYDVHLAYAYGADTLDATVEVSERYGDTLPLSLR